MAERIENELTELHPDQQLALRIENGELTKEQVAEVWAETRDLSAQTDFDTRRAVIALRKCGSLNDAWPVFFTQMTQMMSEMRGAMVNENSKFAHLVSGAESIVKTLQAVNPLKEKLDTQLREIQDLKSAMRAVLTEVRELKAEKELNTQRRTERKKLRAASRARTLEPVDDDAEQARKDTIGSAWAK